MPPEDRSPAGEPVEASVGRVERRIAAYDASEAVVAFSGGVDSGVVLALAARSLGAHAVTAATAVSASYPDGELELASRLAADLGVRHEIVRTRELEKESYARNDATRCLHCKLELYGVLHAAPFWMAQMVLLAGANADDTRDFRPGLLAAERYQVRNPLLDERIGKALVRRIARWLDLTIAEKPALACLASRVASGIRVTPDLLARIDRAERAVRSLGFDPVRVRHYGTSAVVEVGAEQVPRLINHPRLATLLTMLRRIGWAEVSVARDGLRTGRMNARVGVTSSLERALERLRLERS